MPETKRWSRDVTQKSDALDLEANVFTCGLGFNWVIVTAYVPALLVSTALMIIYLRRPSRALGT